MNAEKSTEAAERSGDVRWTALLPWAVAVAALAAMHGAGMVARHERVAVDTLAMMGCAMSVVRCRGTWRATLATAGLCTGLAAFLWLFPAG